jgi:hypothetical protein
MPKRPREVCSTKRTKRTKRTHHQAFLERERTRIEGEREEQSQLLIAELQQEDAATLQRQQQEETENLLACVEMERQERQQVVEKNFEKRKCIQAADRERLKQDLEYVNCQYNDMRQQLLNELKSRFAAAEPVVPKDEAKGEAKDEAKEEAKDEAKEEAKDTEKRLLHVELCGTTTPLKMLYRDVRAYSYACKSLEQRRLSLEQTHRLESALKRCKKNGWK